MSAINIAWAVNAGRLSATEVVPVALGRALSCATDAAQINAMRNFGNYCGSLAGRVTAN